MGKYYDGTKLLSMLDVDGKKPEIYMCTTNRTGGKTTYFGRLCVNRFLKYGEKFCLLYRFNYELSNVADKFFKDLNTLFFPGMEMTATAMGSGAFMELQLDEKPCGYAISLNNADQIKRMSHLFSDVSRIIFDEFQSETNHYCSNEVSKFIGIHTSIARGQGEQVRKLRHVCSAADGQHLFGAVLRGGAAARCKNDSRARPAAGGGVSATRSAPGRTAVRDLQGHHRPDKRQVPRHKV